jgi:predicted amidohydrolase
MHSVMGEPEVNLGRVEHWMREAHAQGATFAVFTEECVTGSMNKSDLAFTDAMGIAERAAAVTPPRLEALCRELRMTAVVGLIEPSGERFLNSALIVGPDGCLATFGKLHLPNETEKEWFESGDSLPVVTSQGWTFSVGICYDVRFPEIFRTAALHGAELFFLPVGGSGHTDRIHEDGDQSGQVQAHVDQVMRLLPARAIDNGLYVFFANQAGRSGRAVFPGYCLAVDPMGELVGEHSTGGEGMIVVEVTKQVVEEAKGSAQCTVGAVRPDVYGSPTIVNGARGG